MAMTLLPSQTFVQHGLHVGTRLGDSWLASGFVEPGCGLCGCECKGIITTRYCCSVANNYVASRYESFWVCIASGRKRNGNV